MQQTRPTDYYGLICSLYSCFQEGLDITKHKLDSAVRYLVRFSHWAYPKNTPAGQVEHWDNGVLLTRYVRFTDT